VNTAAIGFGQVRHARLRPKAHAFAYATYFLMLPLRSAHRDARALAGLARNRFAPLSFFDADHGDGDQPDALTWLDALLTQHNITDATGEAWLQCYPRVWGHTFKPVSFWYCERPDTSLRCIVVEVNNTFGERHVYLLDDVRYGAEVRASKAFHVSPFCAIEGDYRFRFLRTQTSERVVVRIDHDDARGPLIQTSISGALEALTAKSQHRALWRYPLLTLAIVARIHWHALRLWFKRVPFFSKPAPPTALVTKAQPLP
jgi:uncharacterized protein